MVDPCDDDVKMTAVPTQVGAPQETVPCDVETVKKIPDELREPQGELLPESPSVAPGPLEIRSLPVAVPCIDHGTYGDTVTYPEGQKTQNLYFSAILSIKEDVLHFIATQHLEPEIAARLNTHTITAKELHSMTGMRNSEAAELIAQANYIQEQLTDAVRSQAQGLLHCYWVNTYAAKAQCPDPEMAHPEDAKDAVFYAEIPAGTIESYASQENANAKAQAAAEAMLNCFYLSDEFIAKCEERPERPLDVMEPVPNDKEPIYPGRTLRVGTVVVPAKKFRSLISKEDANLRAREWGYAQLVCWYPNLIVDAQCDDPNARDVHVDPSKEPAHDADINKRKVGQRVHVPYGFFTSELSTELATQEAESLAESLLQCCFINKPIDLVCEAQEVFLSDGTKATISPEIQYSPQLEVHVAAGEYTSCVSQEEADHFAQLMVEGMLSCRYCNLPVMPSCVPSWVVEGVENGTIDIPLTEGEIKDAAHPEGVSPTVFPLNSTRGVPKCTIISPNAQASQQMAEMLGALPIVSAEDSEMCTFYNDEVIVACAASDPYKGTITEEEEQGYWAVRSDTGESYFFYSVYPPDTCLYTRMTIPLPGQYVRVKVGMFAGQGEEQKEIVNQRAIVYAMSMLQCWFANPRTESYCDAPNYAKSLCDSGWSFGDPSLVGGPASMMQDWSNTPSRPIVLPEGQIVVTGVSQEEAFSYIYAYTRSLILAQVLCVYGNYEVQSGCSNAFSYKGKLMGGRTICGELHSIVQSTNPLVIEEKTFSAPTVNEATSLAATILYNINFCSSDDFIVYYYCLENPEYDDPVSVEPPTNWPNWNPQPPTPWLSMSSSSPRSSDDHSSSEPITPPVECTLEFDVDFDESGAPIISNVRVAGTGESPGTGFIVTGGGGPHEEGETITITVSMDPSIPPQCTGCYASCTGSVTVTVQKRGNSSSTPGGQRPSDSGGSGSGDGGSENPSSVPQSSPQEGCYQQCPNYRNAQTSTTSATPQFQELTRDFTLWENDVAYMYEALNDELRQLERQLQELMAQL